MIRKLAVPVIFLVLFALFTSLNDANVEATVKGEEIPDKLAKAIDLYLDLEFEKAWAITEEVMASKDLTSNDSIAVYEVKSLVTYARGQQYKNKAFGYLNLISDIGHCLIHLPREVWPPELRDKWYELSKNKNMLVCPSEADPEIQTIAVIEFDNFSVGKYKEELGDLSKGLADFFEYDFSKISDLKVVERDKIDYILRELKLAEEGKLDGATAARVGKMLGAQLMVFGSITQLDSKNARMVARVVKVETSEIVMAADKEGKPDFIKMEKELVKEIAEKLDVKLSKETEAEIMESNTDNMDAAKLYGLGLKYLDKYDYTTAYDYFKKAYEKDDTFVEAKRKMEVYRPLIG